LDPNVANTPDSRALSMAGKEHGTLRKSSTHPVDRFHEIDLLARSAA
jgi:hypothetical protein